MPVDLRVRKTDPISISPDIVAVKMSPDPAALGDPVTPGTLIAIHRKAIGETQKEFAKRLGVSKQMLCDLEAGRRGLSIPVALRLEEFTTRTAFGWMCQDAAWDLHEWLQRYPQTEDEHTDD